MQSQAVKLKAEAAKAAADLGAGWTVESWEADRETLCDVVHKAAGLKLHVYLSEVFDCERWSCTYYGPEFQLDVLNVIASGGTALEAVDNIRKKLELRLSTTNTALKAVKRAIS